MLWITQLWKDSKFLSASLNNFQVNFIIFEPYFWTSWTCHCIPSYGSLVFRNCLSPYSVSQISGRCVLQSFLPRHYFIVWSRQSRVVFSRPLVSPSVSLPLSRVMQLEREVEHGQKNNLSNVVLFWNCSFKMGRQEWLTFEEFHFLPRICEFAQKFVSLSLPAHKNVDISFSFFFQFHSIQGCYSTFSWMYLSTVRSRSTWTMAEISDCAFKYHHKG